MRADLADSAFVKNAFVYGHIDEKWHAVRKRPARKKAITDKMIKNGRLSVNPHHNGQKFTDKSLKNAGLSVKCILLTDKSAKNGTLSVNLDGILAELHCI